MEIRRSLPPNHALIEQYFPHRRGMIYCYGKTIYNPDDIELTPDVIHHESIHTAQQGDDPAQWWVKYLANRTFRLQEELAAYGEQFAYAKKRIEAAAGNSPQGKKLAGGKNNLIDFALNSVARALSEDYALMVSFGEARSKIRNYAKSL